MTREQSWISRDILTVSGTLGNHGIESLSGELLLISQAEKGSILYHMNDDESFTLKIHTPSGDLDGDGRLKKDDILINVSVAGFSSTFEQKNNPDGSWAGKFQLPVGLIKWSGSLQNHTLDDLHIEGTSPLAGVKIDLTKKGDSVSWPYSIITQGQEVSSGTVTLRKIPKYFDIRIDTILPTMALPSFFEFHNFTDIRWDKEAKIKEPEQAEPLTPLMLKGMKDAKKSDTDSPVDIDFTNL